MIRCVCGDGGYGSTNLFAFLEMNSPSLRLDMVITHVWTYKQFKRVIAFIVWIPKSENIEGKRWIKY